VKALIIELIETNLSYTEISKITGKSEKWIRVIESDVRRYKFKKQKVA